jgi:hypothetical protein
MGTKRKALVEATVRITSLYLQRIMNGNLNFRIYIEEALELVNQNRNRGGRTLDCGNKVSTGCKFGELAKRGLRQHLPKIPSSERADGVDCKLQGKTSKLTITYLMTDTLFSPMIFATACLWLVLPDLDRGPAQTAFVAPP